MIHSMAGGKLGEEQFVNLAKLKFDNEPERTFWFLSKTELKIGDKVLAPHGPIDELKPATVVQFDFQKNSKNVPFNLKALKYVFKKI